MRQISVLGALLAGAIPALAAAQSPAPAATTPTGNGARSVVTQTRTAVVFTGLERDLAEAIQRKDTAAIDRLVSDDFELRGPARPGESVPREEWQAAVFAAALDSFRISEMAVHTAGDDTAIVSFAYDQQAKAPAPSGRFAFVDLWRQHGGKWRLEVRYAAPATDAPLPGLVLEPEIPKKY